ncbi:hypothetical protein OIU89_26980 [Escherichia coli]|nr:hypothetical protein [Escherichia coli]
MSADVKMVSRENSDLKKELERVKEKLEKPKPLGNPVMLAVR